MNKQDILAKSAIASLLAFGSMALTTPAVAADKPKMEQCYGIAKAGKNDCAGGKGSANSCAGTAKKDSRLLVDDIHRYHVYLFSHPPDARRFVEYVGAYDNAAAGRHVPGGIRNCQDHGEL